jgi:hypothetical protein
MKKFLFLVLAVLGSDHTNGQDYYEKLHESLEKEYEKFVHASLSNDSATAMNILENNKRTQVVEKKYFPTENIPEHIFNIKIAALKDSIIDFFKIENGSAENKILSKIFYFNRHEERMSIFFSAETSKDTIFSKEYFSSPDNIEDLYLTSFHELWVSKLYYAQDHPLKYTADFALKLTAIDTNTTRLKVIAIDPEVVNGMSIGIHGPMNVYTKVQSTTIEEYAILLFIAEKLGDRALLPLKIPKDH